MKYTILTIALCSLLTGILLAQVFPPETPTPAAKLAARSIMDACNKIIEDRTNNAVNLWHSIWENREGATPEEIFAELGKDAETVLRIYEEEVVAVTKMAEAIGKTPDDFIFADYTTHKEPVEIKADGTVEVRRKASPEGQEDQTKP